MVGIEDMSRRMDNMFLIFCSALLSLAPSMSPSQPLEAIEGEMRCEVLSTRVTSVSNGDLEIYRGVSGEFSVGDELYFFYRSSGSTIRSFHFELDDRLRDEAVLFGGVNGGEDVVWQNVSAPTGIGVSARSAWDGEFLVGINYIFAEGWGQTQITLEEQASGLWGGIGVRRVPHPTKISVQTFALSCEHINDALSDVIEAIIAQNIEQ